MAGGRRWRRLRIAFPIILLVMILMRLVWMQLRSYEAEVEPRALISLEMLRHEVGPGCEPGRFLSRDAVLPTDLEDDMQRNYLSLASPGYALLGMAGCEYIAPQDRIPIKINQWLFVATVLMASLMTRFVTSSWTISLTVAAMLLSRGRLLAEIGSVSIDFPVMLLITTWLTCMFHFIRSGAIVSLAGAVVAALLASAFDRSLTALCLATPLFLSVGFLYRRRLARPVIRRLRGMNRRRREVFARQGSLPQPEAAGVMARFTGTMRWMLGMEFPPLPDGGRRLSYERGTLFRTINVPFLLWIFWRRRWLTVSLGWVAAFATAMLAWHFLSPVAWLSPVGQPLDWLTPVVERVDLHFAFSVVVIAVCAAQSPAAGLPSFLEGIWLALFAMGLIFLAAAFADTGDFAVAHRLLADGVEPGTLGALPVRPVGLWLEPIVLSLGVAGIYNLMKVLDTRIAEKA